MDADFFVHIPLVKDWVIDATAVPNLVLELANLYFITHKNFWILKSLTVAEYF